MHTNTICITFATYQLRKRTKTIQIMKALIIKGEHKGKLANVTRVQKQEIGIDKMYQLAIAGAKIWNGQFSNFPDTFIKVLKA